MVFGTKRPTGHDLGEPSTCSHGPEREILDLWIRVDPLPISSIPAL
jgi:hypothetical protein